MSCMVFCCCGAMVWWGWVLLLCSPLLFGASAMLQRRADTRFCVRRPDERGKHRCKQALTNRFRGCLFVRHASNPACGPPSSCGTNVGTFKKSMEGNSTNPTQERDALRRDRYSRSLLVWSLWLSCSRCLIVVCVLSWSLFSAFCLLSSFEPKSHRMHASRLDCRISHESQHTPLRQWMKGIMKTLHCDFGVRCSAPSCRIACWLVLLA